MSLSLGCHWVRDVIESWMSLSQGCHWVRDVIEWGMSLSQGCHWGWPVIESGLSLGHGCQRIHSLTSLTNILGATMGPRGFVWWKWIKKKNSCDTILLIKHNGLKDDIHTVWLIIHLRTRSCHHSVQGLPPEVAPVLLGLKRIVGTYASSRRTKPVMNNPRKTNPEKGRTWKNNSLNGPIIEIPIL